VSTMKHIGSAKALGRIIRDRRKSMGLTQALTGKMVGVHQPTVSEVERGEREVKIDTLLKLIGALQLELLIQPIQLKETHWEDIWENNGT
jgi:HTH-type transcriptional regulator/antitoxin HipB